MKRQTDSTSSGPSSASSGRAMKRTKSVQACAKCRLNKTRCEVLDSVNQPVIRCHRCKVLEVECSYQTMDRSLFEVARTTIKGDEHSERHDRNLDVLSGYSGTPTPRDAPGSSNASLPTDLFPNRPHLLWDFLRTPQGSLDWTAPLQAMQELMKQSVHSSDTRRYSPAVPNDSLDSILSMNQIQHLTSLFEHNYLPWLNFIPIRETRSPTLDLVYCTIASRHFDEATRSVVAPRLQSLAADNVARMIFQSRRSETLESIQCLLILSLWAPTCGADENLRDGRLLVASAVSMAHNMRLNDACQLAARLREKRAKGEEVSDHEMFDAMNKTRLWIALTNVESLLCAGTGRNPLSKRTAEYLTIFPLTSNLPLDMASGRDLRLRLLAELFDITEAGIAIRLQSLSETDVNSWYDGFVHVLSNLNRVARILLPLAVVGDFDVFYFKSLNIIVRTCRLLILYQASLSAREYFVSTERENPFWFREVRPHGLYILITWGKETMAVSESIMVTLLELDLRLLGTSPDDVFNMIAFAASYIIGSKFLVLESIGIDLPGSGEKLLRKTIDKLHQCSYSPDSAARKCADLISCMLSLWENKLASLDPKKVRFTTNNTHIPSERFQSSRIRRTATPPSDSSQNSSPQSYIQKPSLRLPQQPLGPSTSMMPSDMDWYNPISKDIALCNDLFNDNTAYGVVPNSVYESLSNSDWQIGMS
ncbi:hypothetical protein J3R30DRAFT_3289733 [Lentinula aciculospora]|uniref:Zn(2)-C6 fungal-type domain-containing protein n=1 Tax=Lentinula aciculospora TaxID=153920 RepID=A0A9W9ACR6_9AGAR|nr:hypothetical protein J3R30DRAFT_3289733 [Lentinula aciculospora]